MEASKNWNLHLILAIFASTIGSSFIFGYATGMTNIPTEHIKEFVEEIHYARTGNKWNSVSITWMLALVVSVFCVTGMIGSLIAGFLADRFGRRTVLLSTSVITLLAAVLMGISHAASSYEVLIVGRVLIGLTSGLGTGVTPMYLNEISPVAIRGFVGVFHQLFITIGIFVATVITLEDVLGSYTLWPIAFSLVIVPSIMMVVALLFCPESPVFLLMKNQSDGALKALRWLRGADVDVTDEFSQMQERSESSTSNNVQLSWRSIFSLPVLRKLLFLSISLHLVTQFSGIGAVMYYSTSIYEASGLSTSKAQYATVGMDFAQILVTLLSASLVDRFGRRPLMLGGITSMCVSSIVLTLCLIFEKSAHGLSYISIVAVISFVAGFSLSLGPLAWLITVEFFDVNVRAKAVGLSVGVNWTSNLIVGLTYPYIQKSIGAYSFLPFTCIIFTALVLYFFILPETKNRSPEVIQSGYGSTGTRQLL